MAPSEVIATGNLKESSVWPSRKMPGSVTAARTREILNKATACLEKKPAWISSRRSVGRLDFSLAENTAAARSTMRLARCCHVASSLCPGACSLDAARRPISSLTPADRASIIAAVKTASPTSRLM